MAEGGGFFRGTSQDQDARFSDKEKKLLKSTKFPEEYSTKVDMKKIKLDVIKPWIAEKVTELLGVEDEVLIGYIFGLLEEKQSPDPRLLQINITGFLARDASQLVLSLWRLLISAQNNIGGIPPEFLEKKKEEIRQKKAEHERIKAQLSKQQTSSIDVPSNKNNNDDGNDTIDRRRDSNGESHRSRHDEDRRTRDHNEHRSKRHRSDSRERTSSSSSRRHRSRSNDRSGDKDKRRRSRSRDRHDRHDRHRHDRNSDRSSDRNSDRGSDRSSDRGSDRSSDRGSDRSSDRRHKSTSSSSSSRDKEGERRRSPKRSRSPSRRTNENRQDDGRHDEEEYLREKALESLKDREDKQ